MKFDKFGAFPKTQSQTTQKNDTKNSFSNFLQLLPTILNNSNSPKKPQENHVTPTKSSNANAYKEYLARHDAHVKRSRERDK